MNLHNQFLDEWFVSYNQVDNDFRAFPFNYNYPVKYNELSNKLTAWVHPFVNNGSTDLSPSPEEQLYQLVSLEQISL